ncbi:hypothetical protein M427DRAFT_147310 [Gonapodya prolifera JEL478]|uniref:DOPA 4,5-dioxygenase n=1 Tax=Gonapodya prolifera (strain JEL478) TaxID=1344416 RepID=A0A139A5A4_GONPJ|nr:hypothetical protein M427DRAFT_147310 [Gonapodya prolifera JEL478]|eukprot:KXS11970.1 hypothetical protein M427DRAFT_147310 [Gonapodya prolifera JEL478]
MADSSHFPDVVDEFHAHIVFHPHISESVQAAVDIRAKVAQRYLKYQVMPLQSARAAFPMPMIQIVIPKDQAASFGEFISWLALNRHPTHSILLHPITNNQDYPMSHALYDHQHLAWWCGPPLPLDFSFGNCSAYLKPEEKSYADLRVGIAKAKVQEEAKIVSILSKLPQSHQTIVPTKTKL